MSRRTMKKRMGGAKRLSNRAKTAKKKLADINRAEKALVRKQKKLVTAESRVAKARERLDQLQIKFSQVEDEVEAASNDLYYYKRQLSYSDLQTTPSP